jgi:hypothetical protein
LYTWTSYGLDGRRVAAPIAIGSRFFLHVLQTLFGGPYILLSNEQGGLFSLSESGRGLKLTTSLQFASIHPDRLSTGSTLYTGYQQAFPWWRNRPQRCSNGSGVWFGSTVTGFWDCLSRPYICIYHFNTLLLRQWTLSILYFKNHSRNSQWKFIGVFPVRYEHHLHMKK